MQYLLVVNSKDILAGEFSYLLKVTNVNKPTHISGALIGHVYIKKTLIEELSTNVTVKNICLADHDSVRIVLKTVVLIDRNTAEFRIIQ